MLRLRRAIGCTHDANGAVDFIAGLISKNNLSGATRLSICYYDISFERFASDIVLEFRIRCGYHQQNQAIVCCVCLAVEVWDADNAGHRARFPHSRVLALT